MINGTNEMAAKSKLAYPNPVENVIYFRESVKFYQLKAINGQILKIWWIKVEIQSIKRIYKTRNPLSSPALSLDRIAIVYNKYDEVLISPKDKKEFIEELLKINPDIFSGDIINF